MLKIVDSHHSSQQFLTFFHFYIKYRKNHGFYLQNSQSEYNILSFKTTNLSKLVLIRHLIGRFVCLILKKRENKIFINIFVFDLSCVLTNELSKLLDKISDFD